MNEFLQRLRERKLVQWALAYAAAAFALLQGLDIVAQHFAWPEQTMRFVIVALAIGFFATLVLAWYHGERGAQRVSGTELLILALLLLIGGGLLWRVAPTVVAPAQPAAAAASLPDKAVTTANAPVDRKSIAVLPFENLSDDKANAYFASGMQDEILTRLSGIRDLKVISRTSTMKYASHPEDLKTVGRQLGVASVLEGSVQKSGEAAHINLQLIDADSDAHLWAESYDRDLKDLFAVERDVAQKVADALKATLLPAESARIANVPTRNSEAYDQLLKGDYYATRFNLGLASDPADAARRGAEAYAAAIAADPQFALAYAKRSILESNQSWYGVGRTEAVEAARIDAAHALSLQPDLPEAHVAMGYFHYWGHRDYAAALAEFAIAGASLPNDSMLKYGLAAVHRRQGTPDLAAAEFERLEVLDPRNSGPPVELALTLILLRRYAEAAAACERALTLAADSPYASLYQGIALQMNGDLAAADRVLKATALDPSGSISLQRFHHAMAMRDAEAALAAITQAPAWLVDGLDLDRIPVALLRGQALALKGDTAAARAAFVEAQKALEAMIRELPDQADYEGDLAVVLAALGKNDAALKMARRAADLLTPTQDAVAGTAHVARLAKVEAQVGEADSASNHIEQLLALPAGHVVSAASLRFDPAWDRLRKDPRFEKLLANAEAAAKATPHTESKP